MAPTSFQAPGAQARALVIEDEPAVFRVLEGLLQQAGCVAIHAADAAAGLALAADPSPSLVLLDIGLPDLPGQEVLSRLKQAHPSLPVVMLTGVNDVGTAVECMRRGADDYLTKPFEAAQLLSAVRAALGRARMHHEAQGLRKALERGFGLERLLGASAPMLALKEALRKAAPHPLSVLLVGESGTGKEAAAEALHQLSPRSSGPFVALDCGAMPENLLESELFGFERGAFTGAGSRKRGRVELAQGGTLFLDEIGNLSLGLQAKLLRFLQTRTFRRLGGKEELATDLRVVAATNAELKPAVAGGAFRQDLYYRLNEVEIRLPPLRERGGDVLELARAFLDRFSLQFHKGPQALSPAAEAALSAHAWPGNVRELMNALRHAAMLAGATVDAGHLPPSLGGRGLEGGPAARGYPDLASALAAELGRLEKVLVARALRAHGGARGTAARELEVDAKTLHTLIKRHGLEDQA